MVSVKKSTLKKVLITIIVAVLIVLIVSFTATKVIYDRVFTRYDCVTAEYPSVLKDTVASREKMTYPSGENSLSGYLYKSTAQSSQTISFFPLIPFPPVF